MAFKLKSIYINKPGVGKVWLYFLAGLLWLGLGVMLVGFASPWLKVVSFSSLIIYIIPGIALATDIYFFGFSKLAKRNILPISTLASEKVCLFAFQGWTSYPLVAFMIALGLYLRVYSPMPSVCNKIGWCLFTPRGSLSNRCTPASAGFLELCQKPTSNVTDTGFCQKIGQGNLN